MGFAGLVEVPGALSPDRVTSVTFPISHGQLKDDLVDTVSGPVICVVPQLLYLQMLQFATVCSAGESHGNSWKNHQISPRKQGGSPCHPACLCGSQLSGPFSVPSAQDKMMDFLVCMLMSKKD